MTSVLTSNGYRKAYDGVLRLCVDGAGTVWSFPNTRVGLDVDNGVDYPATMDSTAFYENRVLGLVTGRLTKRGKLKIDRGFDLYLTAAFGARTAGKLADMIATIIPYSGGSAETFAGVYWDTLTLTFEFSASGSVTAVNYEASGMVVDPNNVLAASNLGAGTAEGTVGVGLSTFTQSSVTNGAGTPTVYDGVRRVTIVFANGMTMDPASYPGHAADRICAGYTPGPFIGKVAITQMKGATNVLPASGVAIPITLKVPSGDGTRTMTLDLSCAADGVGQSFSPTDYNSLLTRYTLFGTNTVNGASAYPFACAVA
jgi:hypothetical protein